MYKAAPDACNDRSHGPRTSEDDADAVHHLGYNIVVHTLHYSIISWGIMYIHTLHAYIHTLHYLLGYNEYSVVHYITLEYVIV